MKNKFNLKKICTLMKNIILLLVVYTGNKLIAIHVKELETKTKIKSKLIKVVVTDNFTKKTCLQDT
jgi:hypothetical protein